MSIDTSIAPGRSRASSPNQTLSNKWYTSPQFFEYELEQIWRREWLCVAHAGQIPNEGDYLTVNIGPDPLIIVRRADGAIAAMSAVCRHRSMLVAEGRGNAKRLTCRYHGWAYALDGRLVSAPGMGQTPDFSRSPYGLPQLSVEVWKNFVFVNYDSQAAALAPRLAELEALLSPYDIEGLSPCPILRADREFASNWKLFLEGSLECYHCDSLHPVQHDPAPTRNTSSDLLPGHPAAIGLRVKTTHQDASFVPPLYKSLFPPLPGLSSVERTRMQWVMVLPNLVLSCYPDSVRGGFLLPVSAGRTVLRSQALYPDEVMSDESFRRTFEEQLAAERPMMQQDLDACEIVQASMNSSFWRPGPLASLEDTLVHFNTWLLERYGSSSGDFLVE
jgi:phenylpropionate dioxygenase-like ring-hydroxylating dioxygenase large terminal subunit